MIEVSITNHMEEPVMSKSKVKDKDKVAFARECLKEIAQSITSKDGAEAVAMQEMLESVIVGEKCFLDCDGNGHWFVMPVTKRKEWHRLLDRWENNPEQDHGFEPWMYYVNGPANSIEFYWNREQE